MNVYVDPDWGVYPYRTESGRRSCKSGSGRSGLSRSGSGDGPYKSGSGVCVDPDPASVYVGPDLVAVSAICHNQPWQLPNGIG